jgi:hypothetical protein
MAWFGVSAVIAVVFEDSRGQDTFPSWENVYLVQAESAEAAARIAERRAALEQSSPEDKFTFDERPARLEFSGIRKIIECTEDAIESGMEVSYSSFIAETKDE